MFAVRAADVHAARPLTPSHSVSRARDLATPRAVAPAADVHARMLELGWGKRPGVTILFGRWQDVMPQLLARRFDGVFFDTYGAHPGKGGWGQSAPLARVTRLRHPPASPPPPRRVL